MLRVKSLVYASVDMNGIYCVRADYEHPEALIAMFNAYTEKLFGEKNDFENYFACKENGNLWQSGPIHMLDADVDIEPFREMKKAMDEGIGSIFRRVISVINLCLGRKDPVLN